MDLKVQGSKVGKRYLKFKVAKIYLKVKCWQKVPNGLRLANGT